MKDLSKSTFFIVMFSMFVIFAITGCSSKKATNNENEENKPKSITAMVDNNMAPYLEVVGKEFEKEYGTKLETVVTDYNNMHNKIVTTLASGGSDVDLLYVDTIWPAEFSTAGFLEPLNQYVTEEVKNKLVDIAYEQMVVNDELVAFPYANEGKFLFYNEKLLKEAGYDNPPKSWDELEKIALDLVDKGIANYGIVNAWKQAEGLVCDYIIYLNAFDGEIKENGEWAFHKDGGLKALEYMVNSYKTDKLIDPSSITLDEGQVLNSFESQNIPFMINWSFAANALKDNPDIKMALIPGIENVSMSSTVTGGGGLGINANSNKKEWAWKFIEFMNDNRTEIIANEYIGSLPAWNDMKDNETMLEQYPDLPIMYEQFDYASSRPKLTQYSQWSKIMQSAISATLNGDKTAEEALMDAKAQMEKEEIE